MRPSTPPRSTNTPKSVMFVTVPRDSLARLQGVEDLRSASRLGLGRPLREDNPAVLWHALNHLEAERPADVALQHGLRSDPCGIPARRRDARREQNHSARRPRRAARHGCRPSTRRSTISSFQRGASPCPNLAATALFRFRFASRHGLRLGAEISAGVLDSPPPPARPPTIPHRSPASDRQDFACGCPL